jgi:hypothetical protein
MSDRVAKYPPDGRRLPYAHTTARLPPVTNDEWRVEVDLEDEEDGFMFAQGIRAFDLDEEARKRLGGTVTVTRDGPRLFLYATSEEAAHEAERKARELLEAEDVSGSVRVTRWHPDAEEWLDASVQLPQTEAQREAERRRHEAAETAEAAEEGEWDYEVHVDPPGHREAVEIEEQLKAEGLPVTRRWKHIRVGAPTDERAEEIAANVHAMAPEGTEVTIGATELQHPLFVFFGNALDRFR